MVERKIATQTGPTLVQFTDKIGVTASILGGLNRSFGRSRILGTALDLGREWRTPGEDDPQNACETTMAGIDKDGKQVTVETCDDRFVGPLPDVWRAQLRFNWSQKVRYLSGDAGPSIGIVGALTATARTREQVSYTAAAGYTIHPKGKPTNILGAALLELADMTNTTGKHPTLLKMLNVRLVLGVPLD
ncbi:MAG TPA: hypothetical protein VES88_12275 [Gemmatimonadaceae bacterium]|nr:hypothetical protein [Gemmatimonadaceae bacterium]